MQLTLLDWAIVLGYLAFALGVGIYYSRRASKDSEEYYLAGRTLPWWVLGTSMVATTFAADTPLAITEMSRRKGIWENWFWWNWLLYGLLAVFLFSRLWRRANVLTENELLEIRYSGKPAACLRVFKAGYFAILYNFIVMAWVINSMSSVLKIMLGDGGTAISQDMMIGILVVIAATYALLSGFWGVVVTDVVQFLIAMFGSVALAVIALNHVGGVDELMTKLDVSLEAKSERLAGAIAEEKSKLKVLNFSWDDEPANSKDNEAIETHKSTLAKLEAEYKHAPKNAEEAVRLFPPFPEGAS